MNIFIIQKSITDLKSPIKRVHFRTNAYSLREFITEMVVKNARKEKTDVDHIDLFDAFTKNGSDTYSYGRKKKKFSTDEMITFALDAFCDKIYMVKNMTKDVTYADVDQAVGFSENDEVVLIKLKYIRGVI